jgi:GTP:adenosylcobinamide-phosphate guanylyltransferase
VETPETLKVEDSIVHATIALVTVEGDLTVVRTQIILIRPETSQRGKLLQKVPILDLSKIIRDRDSIEDLTIMLKTVRIPALMIKEDIIKEGKGDISIKIVTQTKTTVFIKGKGDNDLVPIITSKDKDNMVHVQRQG